MGRWGMGWDGWVGVRMLIKRSDRIAGPAPRVAQGHQVTGYKGCLVAAHAVTGLSHFFWPVCLGQGKVRFRNNRKCIF